MSGMSKAKRRVWHVMNHVDTMAYTFLRSEGVQEKTRKGCKRIMARLSGKIAEWRDMDAKTRSAIRKEQNAVLDVLEINKGKDRRINMLTWLYSNCAILADEVYECRNDAVREELRTLEGMCFTMCQHLDPDMEDTYHMEQGAILAQQFRSAIA